MKQKYVEICSHLTEDIMLLEADPEKIKEIERQREVDRLKVKEAREKNGEEK